MLRVLFCIQKTLFGGRPVQGSELFNRGQEPCALGPGFLPGSTQFLAHPPGCFLPFVIFNSQLGLWFYRVKEEEKCMDNMRGQEVTLISYMSEVCMHNCKLQEDSQVTCKWATFATKEKNAAWLHGPKQTQQQVAPFFWFVLLEAFDGLSKSEFMC